MKQYNDVRRGCKDIWNAYMCEGATFSKRGIPHCPTTADDLPQEIILWDEAVRLYRSMRAQGSDSFTHPAFVAFYLDDYKFDGPRGIWHNGKHALEVLRHFAGVITPDFSTYQDFPDPIKIHNTYRMRVMGYWFGKEGLAVINNVRWGTPETWDYCWDGIPKNSIVCIGTAGGSPRRLADRSRFEAGIKEMTRRLSPRVVLVYGSASYPCFDWLREQGVLVQSYKSHTALAFERRQKR